MQEVITGSKPDIEAIISFCETKQFEKRPGKIRFGLNVSS